MSNQLSDQVQRWVEQSIHPQAKIKSTQRLKGGMSSVIQLVKLDIAGHEREVVLRQVHNEEWLAEEPDLAAHEAESLQHTQKIRIPTPEIINFDIKGEECGIPTVLMSKLEGSVVLQPTNHEKWIEGLARTLAVIHEVEPAGFPWSYYTYKNVDSLDIPNWSAYPGKWRIINEIASGPRPTVKDRFIHRDYHAANVLWSGDSVSGVVDWVNACRGPAGIDVGHCRVDLAQLYGLEAADAFLSAYQKFAGVNFQYDPYWDVISLVDILFGQPQVYTGWTDLGMTGLTNQLMEMRLDAYMNSLVEKI
ncbi:aminoglycoside phosphotransferase family protein [Bacillus niameyensis]|uniref:aminoglycoside phosphotransferase family protein n=1 Tax=Bacillus niameyensis TaxID=1522308 RepID=UPI000783F1BB|nr:aminoglycoside phosphotransferase family protein [Bacillus niameyensis]